MNLTSARPQQRIGRRWAFGLPTGMGKSRAIISFCRALAALKLNHVSVAVSAAKVEALCQMKRDMIAAGIPSDRIGLIHSKLHDPTKHAAKRFVEQLGRRRDHQT